MKKYCLRILSAFFALAALGAAARSQVSDQLIVNVPYDFVVAGKTLPAGSYRVSRANSHDDRVLLISSFENRASAMVLATEIVDATGAERPRVSFREVGDQHFLTRIETADHAFTIRPSGPAILETPIRARNNQPTGVSGAAGSN